MEFDSIPVTILTGFLGSGKTTLLNHILNSNHGKRFAIIENEFGEIGIDNELIDNTKDNLFEMNNGCLCCTVRTDLIRILEELWSRRVEFDYVLIESTGLADPGAVVQTFVWDPSISKHYRLDAIIAMADALHLERQLKNAPEAVQQLRFADVILLNKTDLISPDKIAELYKTIRIRNLHCHIYPTAFAQVSLDCLLSINAFDLDNMKASDPDFLDISYPFEWAQLYNLDQGNVRIQFENTHRYQIQLLILYANDGDAAALANTIAKARTIFRQGLMSYELSSYYDTTPLFMYTIPESLEKVELTLNLPEIGHYLFFLEEHPHHFELWKEGEKHQALLTKEFKEGHHNESIQAVALTFDGTLDGAKVDDWFMHLLQTQGDDLYRIKGILNLNHSDQKIIIQAVHHQLNSRYGASWGSQIRQNTIVFIGRNVNKLELEKDLKACLIN